jgi:hypothetical protein
VSRVPADTSVLLLTLSDTIETLEWQEGRMDLIRHEAKIRFSYPFTGEATSEVLVPPEAMVQGEAWVKARIEGWFRYHNRPEPGELVEIPDYQFDPTLFQPSR